jgi:hypothetical protein
LPELRIASDPGYLRLPSGSMPDLSHVLEIGHARAAHAAAQVSGATPGGKTFTRYRFTQTDEVLALLKVALDRRLLAMASSYFGVFPVISEADFFCAFPVEGPFKKSQLWHCDHDGEHVLKIFIYCEDVNLRDGPFELVPAPKSAHVRERVDYRYAGRRYRVADDVMAQYAGADEIVSMVGPAGTSFVADTVLCFHRGSRIREPGHRRIAAMVCYVPPSGSKLPLRLASGNAPMINYTEHFSDPVDLAALGVPLTSKWL